jgi:hypothetical protein
VKLFDVVGVGLLDRNVWLIAESLPLPEALAAIRAQIRELGTEHSFFAEVEPGKYLAGDIWIPELKCYTCDGKGMIYHPAPAGLGDFGSRCPTCEGRKLC